ncbi:hypothetical protein MATL_G00092170 [Megalops atlanticus]|uniref:RNA exonuclease 4 n=1 Tax=Megalops atlanticus TaxID=7932 RepID=A0A9D3Q3S0_MEGAT|nr:hypothetical protein MATL_G00092170 [Megalops atlanticus]
MMSKVKPSKSDSTVITSKMQTATKPGKKKNFWKHAKKGLTAKGHDKNTFALPPKDSQQFSANWKALQEVFKMTTKAKNTETNQPEEEQRSTQERAQKKPSNHIPSKTQNVKPAQVYTEKMAKHGAVFSKPQENGKGHSRLKQSKAHKRKHKDDSVSAETTEQQNKKKKVAEEAVKKPTEEDLWFDDVDPDDIEATVGTEAADIIRKRQGTKTSDQQSAQGALVKENAFDGLTKAVAMDCEMVGVGPEGEDSIVARVSLVNQFGKCIYDKYVKPTERVTDYRTAVSGIRPQDIKNGENVKTVQKEVADILQGRILVGHAIHNDLKILLLDHPKKKIRDTQKYKPFKKIVKSGRPSLKLLCEKILHVKVQQGEHSSVQDAQATMRLYTLVKKEWEMAIKAIRKNKESTEEKTQRKPRAPGGKSESKT